MVGTFQSTNKKRAFDHNNPFRPMGIESYSLTTAQMTEMRYRRMATFRAYIVERPIMTFADYTWNCSIVERVTLKFYARCKSSVPFDFSQRLSVLRGLAGLRLVVYLVCNSHRDSGVRRSFADRLSRGDERLPRLNRFLILP